MFGAEALVRTLADCGVSACFANPGTSEMHLVAALDREPRIRTALCLFEGVATGAADGYARITGKPAMTLLHLGSGLANGSANLHNARRAGSPIVNVIGDHATYHLHLDAPLTSDILGVARPNLSWVKTVASRDLAGPLAAEAFAAAMAGAPVGLILPADSAWTEPAYVAPPLAAPLKTFSAEAVEAAARALKAAKKPLLLINGSAGYGAGLEAAGRIAGAGVRVLADTFIPRLARGRGRFAAAKMQYFAEMAMADLDGVDLMVLAGTQAPAAFFAYPGKPGLLVPAGAEVLTLAPPGADAAGAVAALAEALGAPKAFTAALGQDLPAPTGALTPMEIGVSIARHLPENAIVCDDGVTGGAGVWAATEKAAAHDWLHLTGGAIGIGMPLAVGAAVAAPERKVIALSGDGAGMYTNQALWTMARESLDILTIVFANRSYRILNIEFARTGAGNPGPTAQAMLSLDKPAVDWVKLAEAMGVRAVRAESAEAFDAAVARFMGEPGPKLIEAML